jgi:hypothetical protein
MRDRIQGCFSTWRNAAFLVCCALALSACATIQRNRAADGFLAALAAHCGKAYAGTMRENAPLATDDPFAGKAIIMHVVRCDAHAVDIALHVGDDRSRTWQLRRTKSGVQLKHRHRHADGSLDPLTNYGGDSDRLHRKRMEFPADAESQALFLQENREVSVQNRWSIEIRTGLLSYELVRPNRLFRLQFDLSQAQPTPPPVWGGPQL